MQMNSYNKQVSSVKPLGEHVIVEAFFKDAGVINDEQKVLHALVDAAERANATVVGKGSHRFSPQGITAFVLLAESHISIHTWPEYKYAAIDIFTCGEGDPMKAVEALKEELNIERVSVMKLDRGVLL